MIDIQKQLNILGVSRRELARRLGVSPASVNSYISGNPTAERIEAIAKALGVSISTLFQETSSVSGFVKIGDTIHELRSVGDLEEATGKAQKLAEVTDTTE
jgi:DNA-binding protein